jgi:hypothetical protein
VRITGLFEKIFGRWTEPARSSGKLFRLLSGYQPAFTTWRGSIYESELIRAAIDAHARHAAKLEPVLLGSAQKDLCKRLAKAPSEWQTWPQFLYQTTTLLYVKNTAFIVPVIGRYGETLGITPIAPTAWELIDYQGEPWLRFTFADSSRKALELRRVGILTRYQSEHELFGENNEALRRVLDLIAIQSQAAQEAAKNSASYRFYGTAANMIKDEDLHKETERFNRENFQNGGGGLLIFPFILKDVKQVQNQSFSVDEAQAKQIRESVFNYFGVNENILQNKAYGDEWNAFYEGAVEWEAVNLSETISRMLFTEREQAFGARIFFASNRMQYMSNSDKLAVAQAMADRGLMTRNEIRAIFNLPPLDGPLGESLPARGEYYNVNEDAAEPPEGDDPG